MCPRISILYSQNLYDFLMSRLAPDKLEAYGLEQEEDTEHSAIGKVDVVLFGCGRYGGGVHAGLAAHGRRVLGVDFDPEAVREWRRNGRMAWFGDAQDPEFPKTLPLSGVRWVLSSIPERTVNMTLIRTPPGVGISGQHRGRGAA